MLTRLEPWFFRLCAFGWMAMVFSFSSKPGSEVRIEHPLDKIIHCGVFGVLSYFLCLGIGQRLQKHAVWIVPVLVSILGALDEFHQSFSPGRSVSAADWISDTAGAVAAAIFWWLAWRQGKRAVKPEIPAC